MLFKKSVMTAAVFAVGSVAVMSANAAASNPATTSFTTQTTVESICTIKAPTNITLDNVQAGKATTTMYKSTSLTVNCSKGDAATISLTPASSGTTDGLGYMVREGSTEKVNYKLTTDAAGQTPWGAALGNKVTTGLAEAYATDIITSIYLTMTNTADVTPGTYNDTINVSVSY